MTEVQSFVVEPLTQEEIDVVTNVAIAGFSIGLISLLIFLACTGYVAFKTCLPGRFLTFFSSILLLTFFAFTHYMGGNLEFVYGPVGALYSVAVYAITLAFFSIGFLKICIHIKRSTNG